MLEQDFLDRIVNVQWAGAVEIPDAEFFPAPAAVTNPNCASPHANALTVSGWVWVPIDTASAAYPLMVFGGDSSGDTSTVTAIVGLDGTFTINVAFTGVPFAVDPLVGDYPGFDYVGWFRADEFPIQAGSAATPVGSFEDTNHNAGIMGLCGGGGGFTVSPFQGCFRLPTDEAVLGQRVTVGSGTPTLAPEQWHHFIASCDTGGLAHWGNQTVAAFMFVNGVNVVEYFPGFFGLRTAAQFGLPDGTTFEPGTGVSIKGRPAAIPRPSSQIGSWPQTPIRFCDWQGYPRLIIPYQHIGKFFMLEDGIRKRVSTKTAEQAFGVMVPDPNDKNKLKPRAMWMFRGGSGSFHKSLNRSTDGEFVKTGEIKTVKPPPLWSPPA